MASSDLSGVHFHRSKVPFCAIEKILLLSAEKKALTIGFLLPANVKGKKCGILCKEIIFNVKSLDHVSMKRESCDHATPVIDYECKFPYFLYKTNGENVLWSIEGLSKILHLVSVATKKNLLSGEKAIAVTVSRKLKCARTTRLTILIISAKPSTSMLIKVRPSGDSTNLATLLLF